MGPMAMRKYSLIVFDWDQTLWDGWELHLQGFWHTADALGLPRPSAEAIAALCSSPLSEQIEGLFQEKLESVLEVFRDFYARWMMELGRPYEGAAEAVGRLKEQGYRLAVLSDKRRSYGWAEAEQSGLAALFDGMHFREEWMRYKPHPERLQRILQEQGVSGQEALYVGDSHVDVACARNAGLAGAAALWGSVNHTATLAQQPRYVWNTLGEMEAALGSGAGRGFPLPRE